MINKKILIIILLCILLNNCSFDNKTGLWDGEEEEREAISKIEEEQNQVINVRKIFSELLTRFRTYLFHWLTLGISL